MSSVALLQSLKENILGQAGVKTIYGEPISAQGKTVIPVAKVAYGYGAGRRNRRRGQLQRPGRGRRRGMRSMRDAGGRN